MTKIECEFCECEDRQNCYRCRDPHLNTNWDFKCKCDRRQQCLCGDWF